MAETTVLELDWPSPKDDRPGFLVRTPYRESFVERLKADLPVGDRFWMPDEGCWWCHDDYLEAVQALVCLHFGGVMVISEAGDEFITRDGRRTTQERLW